ncbi:leucine-rich repeat-containing protein 46 isoform X2 [Molothrus ater]|uniref:leucine-rich repeat-containing protein 46 isoform X2 n=1 Tax=Molothrus ater TaxID=84834 RepID=UPI00174CFA57|nr:leucine-rich repeat-containing protein 46 isoform X2 [Molothrus ater]
MAEQGDALCGAPEEPSPGVTLSDGLIMAHTRSTGPLPTGTVRLDRENISCIGKTRGQERIHSLYLQQNQIEKMENLECFPNLRFLCLAGNRIQRVQNLQGLSQLSLLDLSHNLIQVLDTGGSRDPSRAVLDPIPTLLPQFPRLWGCSAALGGVWGAGILAPSSAPPCFPCSILAEELPRSLRILDLAGNQCTQQEGYRDGVLAALPQLLQLDSQPVQGSVAEEEEGGGSCSSEEEEEELLPVLRAPFTVDRGFLGDVRRELAGRARLRRTLSLEEHRARLQELRERRALLLGPGQGGTARPCPQPCPQGHPGPPPPPLPASSGSSQPPGEALQMETRASRAENGQLSQIP